MNNDTTLQLEKIRVAIPSSNVLQDWQELEWQFKSNIQKVKEENQYYINLSKEVSAEKNRVWEKLSELETRIAEREKKLELLDQQADTISEWIEEEKERMRLVNQEFTKSITKAQRTLTQLNESIKNAKEKVGLIGRIFKK